MLVWWSRAAAFASRMNRSSWFGASRCSVRQHLQGDVPAEALLHRLVDDPHAPAADLPHHAVVAQDPRGPSHPGLRPARAGRSPARVPSRLLHLQPGRGTARGSGRPAPGAGRRTRSASAARRGGAGRRTRRLSSLKRSGPDEGSFDGSLIPAKSGDIPAGGGSGAFPVLSLKSRCLKRGGRGHARERIRVVADRDRRPRPGTRSSNAPGGRKEGVGIEERGLGAGSERLTIGSRTGLGLVGRAQITQSTHLAPGGSEWVVIFRDSAQDFSPGTTWTWGENFRDFEIGAFKVLQTWTILLVGRLREKIRGPGVLARCDARKQSRAGGQGRSRTGMMVPGRSIRLVAAGIVCATQSFGS